MTIKSDAEEYAKFLFNRWRGESTVADLAILIVNSKEQQREMDCKALCSYCGSDGYGHAYRLGGGAGWEHEAVNDSYIPKLVPCQAMAIREAWFDNSAPSIEQLANECAASILGDMLEREGFDYLWAGCDDKAKGDMKQTWKALIQKAIETYRDEGLK